MTGCTPGEFTAARGAVAAARPGPPGADRMTGEATSLLLPVGRSAHFSKTGRII
jgi:hypothetical protein